MKKADMGADGIIFEDSAVEGVMQLTELEAGHMMRQLCRVREKAPEGTMVHVTAARLGAHAGLGFSWHLEPADDVDKIE